MRTLAYPRAVAGRSSPQHRRQVGGADGVHAGGWSPATLRFNGVEHGASPDRPSAGDGRPEER